MSNDRFKFRVWDTANNRFVDTFCDPYNRIVRWYIDINGNLIGVEEDMVDRVQDKDNFIIEQCTGLTDRHNKLIYENDVVNMYIPYEDNHRKCVVRYVIDEGTAQWLAVYLEGSRKHQFFGKPFEITSEYLDGSYCTVIGNIHDDQFRNLRKMMEDKYNGTNEIRH